MLVVRYTSIGYSGISIDKFNTYRVIHGRMACALRLETAAGDSLGFDIETEWLTLSWQWFWISPILCDDGEKMGHGD